MRKGFTLIELLIVIAIIAILAAIAIPQFARYRIRAYNAAAESDLKNARTTEEAFFADWQTYGKTEPDSITVTITDADGHTDEFTLSTRVGIVIYTDDHYVSYVMMTKHTNGDTYYGADSDVQGVYYERNSDFINNSIVTLPSDAPTTSTPQQDNFGGNWKLQ